MLTGGERVLRPIAVVDYGSGNVASVFNAILRVADSAKLVTTSDEIVGAGAIVLPGVGAFPAFMDALEQRNLVETLVSSIRAGVPLLGICVGMQALASMGLENGQRSGLSINDGVVQNLADLGVSGRRLPHVGWNSVTFSHGVPDDAPIRVLEDRDVYFMHSYGYSQDTPGAVGWTNYGVDFCSVIQSGTALGVQFHPEKSQQAGLDFLAAWADGLRGQ